MQMAGDHKQHLKHMPSLHTNSRRLYTNKVCLLVRNVVSKPPPHSNTFNLSNSGARLLNAVQGNIKELLLSFNTCKSILQHNSFHNSVDNSLEAWLNMSSSSTKVILNTDG